MDWMNLITDEMLFQGGILLAVAAFAVLLLSIMISRISLSRLKKQLETEYGSEKA